MMVKALLEPISAPMGGESSERPERHPIQEQLGDRVQDRRGDPNDFTVAVLETLLDSADVGYMDVLGEVYMRYARLGAIRSSETYPDL